MATLSLNATSQRSISSQNSNLSVNDVPDISYDVIIHKLDRLPNKYYANRLRKIKEDSTQIFLGQREYYENQRQIRNSLLSLAASLAEHPSYLPEAELVRQLSEMHKDNNDNFDLYGGGRRRRTTKKLRGRRRHHRNLTKRHTLRRK